MERCKVSLGVARCSGVGASFTGSISFASSSRLNRVWHARGRPDLWLEQGYWPGGVARIFRSPAVLMILDLRIARFAWPGMPDAAASRSASLLQSPEALGSPTLSAMDHWRGNPSLEMEVTWRCGAPRPRCICAVGRSRAGGPDLGTETGRQRPGRSPGADRPPRLGRWRCAEPKPRPASDRPLRARDARTTAAPSRPTMGPRLAAAP